ncbi:MAG: flippase [Bacteroidota bacterium]
MSEKSYWLKSGFFSLFERGSVFLFGLGSFLFLANGLDKADWGTWVIFLVTTSFIEVGRSGLLQNALVKYLTTCEQEEYGVITTASLFTNVVLTALSILLLFAIAEPLALWQDAPILATLVRIYAITTVVLIPLQQFNFIQQGNLDFKGIFWSNFTKQGLFFFFIAITFLSGNMLTLVDLAKAQIGCAVAGAIVSFAFAKRYLQFSRTLDFAWVKKLFSFGKYVFGTNLSAMLYKSIDKYMLGYLVGPAFTGAYENAVRVTNLAEVPTFSIAQIVFPQGAKKIKSEGKPALKALYEKSVGAIFAIILPFIIFVFLFPDFIINTIAPKWTETIPVLRLTILYGLFLPFAIQFGTVLDAMGRPKINFYFTILGAGLNIIFNYLFISKYGLIGAAYGTLTTYSITFLLNQIVLYRVLKVKAWNVFGYMFRFYTNGIQLARDFIRTGEASTEKILDAGLPIGSTKKNKQ